MKLMQTLVNKKSITYCVSTVIVIGVLVALWFFTPAQTLAARFLWNRYHVGSLALSLDQRDAPLAFTIGNSAFGRGPHDLELAERAYRKAIAIDPGILWGHYQLARILFVEGKLTAADAEINTELSQNPTNLRALYVRGLVRAYSGDLKGAGLDFKRFTEWAPTEWAGYNDLAWVLGQEGKYAEAKAALQKGIRSAKGADDNPWLWLNLGVQELNLAEYKHAVTDFEKAKALAAKLDEQSWHASYPGNDPSESASGIETFKAAIETNLESARSKLASP